MSQQVQPEGETGRRVPLLFLAGALLAVAAAGGTTALLLRGGAGGAEAPGASAVASASAPASASPSLTCRITPETPGEMSDRSAYSARSMLPSRAGIG